MSDIIWETSSEDLLPILCNFKSTQSSCSVRFPKNDKLKSCSLKLALKYKALLSFTQNMLLNSLFLYVLVKGKSRFSRFLAKELFNIDKTLILFLFIPIEDTDNLARENDYQAR